MRRDGPNGDVVGLSRRSCLGLLASVIVDPEKLVWKPGKRLISIPKTIVPPPRYWVKLLDPTGAELADPIPLQINGADSESTSIFERGILQTPYNFSPAALAGVRRSPWPYGIRRGVSIYNVRVPAFLSSALVDQELVFPLERSGSVSEAILYDRKTPMMTLYRPARTTHVLFGDRFLLRCHENITEPELLPKRI